MTNTQFDFESTCLEILARAFIFSGPIKYGTNVIVKLEAVIFYDAKEFDAGFR